jgi:hypothetical protein
MKLYDLTDEYLAIMRELDAADGEVTDDLEARLDAFEGDFAQKVESLCAMVRTLEGEASMLREEEKRLAARRQSREGSASRIKAYLQTCMDRMGQRKVKAGLFTATVQKNPPRAVLDVDAEAVPEAWVQTVRKPDLRGLVAALKAGDESAAKVAHLEQSEGVRIR